MGVGCLNAALVSASLLLNGSFVGRFVHNVTSQDSAGCSALIGGAE